MVRVARYSSDVLAEAAAAFLRDAGIPATVVGHMLPETVSVLSSGMLATRALDVVIPSADLRERALALLDEFTRIAPQFDEDWEDDARPDLSRLPARFAPPCPGCGGLLPLDEALDACPTCVEPIDVVELIVARHGPEALAPCYDPDPARIDDAVDRALPLPAVPAPDAEHERPLAPAASPLRQAPSAPAPRTVAPRCRTCNAPLPTDFPRGRCPSCGTLFDLADATRSPLR